MNITSAGHCYGIAYVDGLIPTKELYQLQRLYDHRKLNTLRDINSIIQHHAKTSGLLYPKTFIL